MKRSTLGRYAVPSAVVLSLGLSACGASNETPPAGGSTASAAPTSGPTTSDPATSAAETSGATTSPSTGGGGTAGGPLSGTIAGVGSSAQQAAITAWIAGFGAANPNANVTYDAQGSGAGRKQFLAGGADFAGSDAYLKDTELATGKTRCAGGSAIDIPTYVSPIAIVYNLPGVSDLKLSPATAAGIFFGMIKTWNDPKITADNPGAKLPSTAISPVHRSDDSGTTQNFTEYLSSAAPAVWTAKPAQSWPVKSGEAAAQTSGMVSAVKAGAGSIGYADESQAGGLGKAQIKVGSAFVTPSADGAAKALAASKPVSGRPTGDLAIAIDRKTTAAGAYPVMLVSYDVACTKYSDATKGNLVKGFLHYAVSSEGQQAAAKNAGSAPLPASLAAQAKTSIDSITTGG